MYEEFYGLKETPFSVQPDPRFAYPSAEHKIAVAKMRYAADGKRGLAVLTGPVGAGKTTIANRLQMTWDEDPTKTVAFLPGAVVRTPGQFLRLILESFGIPSKRTEAQNRDVFERFLLDEFAAGRHPVLLLDEGQNLASRVIDAISDLTNFQTASTKLMTVVMLAQDNLPKKLERHDAFRSRIAVVGHLDPLTLDEMREMIRYRLVMAGGGPIESYFEPQALADCHAITKGVPRDICVLCDALFVNGYVRDQRVITSALVQRTLSEMSREKKWPVQLKDGRK
jgi:general secretion pathway protein A